MRKARGSLPSISTWGNQTPGVITSVLSLVGQVSIYCDWVRRQVKFAHPISVWQHVHYCSVRCILARASLPGEQQMSWPGPNAITATVGLAGCASSPRFAWIGLTYTARLTCKMSLILQNIYSIYSQGYRVHHRVRLGQGRLGDPSLVSPVGSTGRLVF